ncbi:hypothetical protein [Litoribacillus peritrichatus]|uniref:Surface antigen domain-containing protein n=1 Tax=Litoribacillus peritrichatus TaxID=718191 RepID=A0ABP7MW22_9GAMM
MRIKLLLSSLVFSAATTVHAGNLGFLSDTVVSEFTPEEAASFKSFVTRELVSLKDSEKAHWKSSTSNLQGIVRPEITFKQDGIPCRQTRFSLKGNNDKKMFFKFDVCKDGDKWSIVQSPLAKFKQQDWEVLEAELTTALDEGEDGHPVSWSIRRIGVTGSIVPLNQSTQEGNTCRDTAFSVADAKGNTSSGRYEFCKVNGTWTKTAFQPKK